jgi:hypothetical protein
MYMSILAIGIVALMGYIWLTRGFFSALIHLVCVVIAGGIAFGVWEQASTFLLASSSSAFITGSAWGLGLALPFAVSLALLRVISDLAIRSNVNPGTSADYVGGAICGALSGVVAGGIICISIGFLRMEPDFLGGTHVAYAQKGYIVRTGGGAGGLWIPIDRWTAKMYGYLSERSFRVEESLAKFHPALDEEPASLRLNALEGKSRNTTKADDFEVVSRFTVGQGSGMPLKSLLRDRWNAGVQEVKDVNDQPYPDTSYLEGYVVRFNAGAKEKEGKVAVGAAQVRLVLQSTVDDSDRMVVYAIACASQAQSNETTAARWRFDSSGTFIASVGAGSEATFAFEFVVPPNYEPIALYVKNVRHVVSEGATAQPKNKFRSSDERDAFLVRIAGGSGSLPNAQGGGNEPPTYGQAVKIGNGQALREGLTYEPEGMKVSSKLPFTLQDGTLHNLEITSEGTKEVIGGEEKFDLNYSNNTRSLEKALRIERFAVTPDTVMVQVDVGANSKSSLLSEVAKSADASAVPRLWDANNQSYEPIGYIYYDETTVTISFKPGEPVRSGAQLPTLSKSRPAQKLTLLYRVSLGAKIKGFAVGKKGIAEYDPMVPCDTPQNTSR